jgi:hypothetical protein
MQDPRALANPKNLESYKAWEQDGVRRSGSSAIFTGAMTLTPVLIGAVLLLKPTTKVSHAWLVLVGTAFALYLAIALGLMLFAVLRLNAWKRAHPWEPPPRRAWK